MKILITIAGLSPEFGGPSRSVPALAEALARENVDVDLVTCESQPGLSAPQLPAAQLVGTKLLPVRSRQGRWRAPRNDFFRAVCEVAGGSDVVIHDNGLWLPTNHAVAHAARCLKRPLVISPRGMLSAWELRHHRWKKRIGWFIFQRRNLLGASALHATSQQEASDFRRVGYRGPIAIVPNAVNLPQTIKTPRARGKVRTAICVTRLHPKKGLINLIYAWSEIRPTGWRMLIAGGDEDQHRADLEAAIVAGGLTAAFEFVGPVEGQQKLELYREADLFVLPSYSENFGMSIAEALANAVPVITTRRTPWKDLIDYRCGWWEEIGVQPLARALREATSLDDEARSEMGKRGRELVAQKYSWPHVAREMKAVYEWLLGQRGRPGCVTLS